MGLYRIFLLLSSKKAPFHINVYFNDNRVQVLPAKASNAVRIMPKLPIYYLQLLQRTEKSKHLENDDLGEINTLARGNAAKID